MRRLLKILLALIGLGYALFYLLFGIQSSEIFNSLFLLLSRLIIILGFFAASQILVEITSPFIERSLKIVLVEDKRMMLSVYTYFIYFVGFILALSLIIKDLSALATSLGLIGLGITYALHQPILNFAGWVLIAFSAPYKTGDRVVIGDVKGDIEKITLMYTLLREFGEFGDAPTGRIVTIPNSKVLTEAIVNYTKEVPFLWDEVRVSITYESKWRAAVRIFERCAFRVVGKEHAKAYEAFYPFLAGTPQARSLKEKPYILVELADSSIDLSIRYLCDARNKRIFRSEILKKVLEACGREKDLEIAYPHMQLVFGENDERILKK
ncbi:MAG: mechanosensitive ion channel family protein [Candidatus Methanofastidiosia archaeon]